jgi:small ligand-binding sensory domain FIST
VTRVQTRYAAALSEHPVPAFAVGEAAGQIIETLAGEQPDLVVWFASPDFVGAMEDISHALAHVLEPGVLIGMSAVAVVGGAREVDDGPGLSIFAATLPSARLTPVALDLAHTPDGDTITGWPELHGNPTTLLLLADPFTFPVDPFLRRLDVDCPGLAVIGGASSSARGPGGNLLALQPGTDAVTAAGAVGVFLEGVAVRTVVSQGARPIGSPFVVTRADGDHIEELGGVPALTRLQECAEDAGEDDRALMRAGLQLGVVVDEHQADFGRGDFLVHGVLGADPRSGSLAVGDEIAVGQTVQFHVRDAAAADQDLRELLAGSDAAAALLFTCNRRGRELFGVPDHDAGLVDQMLGPLPIAGACCAGAIGPIGGRNLSHQFTASLALF